MTIPQAARADAVRNREAAIDAAVDLLARRPDASMREIADSADLGRTTLYRHFPAREDLILAIFERSIEEARTITAAAVSAGGTAGEVLSRLAMEIVAMGARYRFLQAHDDLRRRALEHGVGVDEPLMTWLRAAQARGELAPELNAEWIFQMTIALSIKASEEALWGELDEESAGRLLGHTLVRAFARQHHP